MNRIKKVSRPAASLLALLLCVTLFASTAFAAGGALGADRNGTPYTYVIGYMYSGSSQTVNTREIFTSPNNYDIWLCPVCGRDPLGNSQGTALAADLYMPCYGYDIAAAGGDMSIRYALVRHRHNNGQLSNDRVYIPVNVPMYAGCYYGYDLTEPAGVQVSAPTGWQRDSAVVRFSGGTDTGTSLPDWSAAPGDYGSGIHHYEYSINGGAWTGCPVGDPTVTITAGGETTVTARGGRCGQRLRPDGHGKGVHRPGPAQCARRHAFHGTVDEYFCHSHSEGQRRRTQRRCPHGIFSGRRKLDGIQWCAFHRRPRQTYGQRPRHRQCGPHFRHGQQDRAGG